MSDETNPQQQKMKPGKDIIAQAKSINYYIEHLIDPSDPAADDIITSWYDLNEQYDFYDQTFEENGHLGLKDIEGHLRVPALYSGFEEIFDLFEFRHHPATAINAEGKAALVATDGTGTPLCPFIYDGIALLQPSSYYCLLLNGKQGLMTSRGEILLPCEYEQIESPTNGIFITRQGNKYGFFCEYGRGFNVPCLYDEIDEDKVYVYARLGNQWGYFNETGQFLPKEQVPHPHELPLLRFSPLSFLP